MIEARCEITLKFSEVPEFQLTPQKTVVFRVRCGSDTVQVEVKQKAFKKLQSAPADYPNGWVCAVNGKLGQRTQDGFMVIEAGLQVFERKPKATPASADAETPLAPVRLTRW